MKETEKEPSKVSDQIADFLDFIHSSEQQYRMAEADEQEANAETQDLLHCLELEDQTYNDSAKIARELKQVRKKRRTAKDRMAELHPICEWADNNRAVIKSMERLLGDVRKAEKVTHGPRIYTPRVRKG